MARHAAGFEPVAAAREGDLEMLYYLLLDRGALNGGHAELRVLLAGISSLIVVIVFGHWFIRFLRRRQVLDAQEKGDSTRLDQLHAHKASTPTLGGIMLFGGVTTSTLLWARLDDLGVLLLLSYTLGLAILGFLDDTRKLRTRRKGLSARGKLFWQLALSAGVAVCLYLHSPPSSLPGTTESAATRLFLPLAGSHSPELGLGFMALVILVTTGTSNAVNLTDGLDGLATGTSVIVALTLGILAFLAGQPLLSGQGAGGTALSLPHVESGIEVAVFLSALVGGGLGFLWFNCHPAQVFMGDTGALPLGGALGLAAVLTKQEMTLLVAGGVLVAEALSVILQVAYFKLTRRRIFLCAPIHHHFQFKGWPETKVTARFWIVGAVLACISFVMMRLG